MSIPQEFADQAQKLMEELRMIGEFRRGTVSMFFRKCGKKGCVCARERHPGHPQTKLTVKEAGKTKSKNLPRADSMKLAREQIQNHDRFMKWCKKWTELNEKISDVRLEEVFRGEEPADSTVEKKRRKRSSRRSSGRLNNL